MTQTSIAVCWFRRDLRLEDNAALYHALRSGMPVLPVFIFDRHILDELADRSDKRVQFIHQAVSKMQRQLTAMGSSMWAFYGTPEAAFPALLAQFNVKAVYTNHDYEPYATQRDQTIQEWLNSEGVSFSTYKDQVIFERDEVTKDDGKPYTVFTPYSKKWLAKLNDFYLKSYPTEQYFSSFLQLPVQHIPSLPDMNFQATEIVFPDNVPSKSIIEKYHLQRDIPGMEGTSRMGVHLRFGTVSIRALARSAKALNATYLNELIWRDFYHMILWHFPYVVGNAFKPAYDQIQWRDDEESFQRWCNGETGYPIVDAGMRQLNETGYMHNRVRMIVASFLTKHLLLDWRLGEAYFAEKLLDFDLAANNGGWQWAAGSGCDAAPYFRVFNPYLQTEKFDPQQRYLDQWCPQRNSLNYPKPIIAHEEARKRCLAVYSAALKPA